MTDQKGIPVGGNHKTRTAEWIGSIHTRVGRRFRRPSPRTVLALATVPAVVVGLAQFSDTSAAFTDTAVAKSSLSSAAKLLPAVEYVYCDTTGSLGFYNAKLRWPHIGSPFKYRVIVKRDDGVVAHTSSDINPGSAAPGTVFYYEIDDGEVGTHTRWAFTAEVHTINPAGEVSADWRGERLWQPTTNSVQCDGARSSISATGGTEQALRMAATPSETPATTEPTTNAKSSTTTGPSTTSGTTTSTTTGSTTPGTTTSDTTSETTTTTTDEKAPVTTPPSEASTTTTTTSTTTAAKPVKSPSNENFAAVLTDATGTHLVVENQSGETVYRTAVPADSTIVWTPDGDIRITNAAGSETVSSDNWTK